MNTKPPLVVIAGPTASGKSALALALSRLTPSVIINADASQVYRDLRVVTSRPTVAEEEQSPHRLFGHIDGAVAWSAADWAAEARAAVAEAHGSGRLPVLVGGSGLYIRTLLDGIAPVPSIDPEVRRAVRALPVAQAHAALASEDAEAATRLAPADTTRVARALEVVRSSGKPLSAWQSECVGGLAAEVTTVGVILLPPRDWLFDRCDTRFDAMFADGQDEVAALVERGLEPALPVMRAIGVREIAGYQARKLSKIQSKNAGGQATRQYAKRQYTWFRNQPPSTWIQCETQLNDVTTIDIARLLRRIALTS